MKRLPTLLLLSAVALTPVSNANAHNIWDHFELMIDCERKQY